ncbi:MULTISPECIES: hypothetical protein [Tissierellales]|jgi:uncharacterized membrane protein YhiD involved in acid resistance|uniref:Uncharacterized protein n=1 Tax=Acidilutibacter cellobiosedens TaxID=2507161 RepID=A0A410QDU0_9FIRM|nr:MULTISPECIES: hypothetical protein [Tissierellales]MBE6081321.1 hypothetical protein [Tissierellaceae bacterium]QAT62150.1 hypothetical protein EQM13_11405 [Acidilutibacter cellobiosedens]SCL84465.1 hypothetical protein PP176A_0644 [Sporanaerobacter sp. PP17-6a]
MGFEALIFAFFIFIIPALLKSSQEKQKIDRERLDRQRRKRIPNQVYKKETDNYQKSVENVEEEEEFQSNDIEEYTQSTVEIEKSENAEVMQQEEKKPKIETKTEKLSRRNFKEDVIRGIIFSEILSKPKSLR